MCRLYQMLLLEIRVILEQVLIKVETSIRAGHLSRSMEVQATSKQILIR